MLAKYPTPSAMAGAPLEQVRGDLRSFGLQWRADTLAASSRVIHQRLGGRVPSDAETLMTLPGVGPYVAAATAASVSKAEVTLVDTNTVRVAGRVGGVFRAGDIRRRADVVAAIEGLLGGAAPAQDWWAVLDLAASICVPAEPRCPQCPISSDCVMGLASAHVAGASG